MDGTDNDESLVGVIETTESWTIKAFSRTLRLAVINAAKTEGITTGQWLERLCRDRLEGGSQVVTQGQTGGVNLGDLAQAYQQARAMAEAAGIPIPPSVARAALSAVKNASRQIEGSPMRQRPAKVIASTVQPNAPKALPADPAKRPAGKAKQPRR